MPKINRPPSAEEFQAHIREQLKTLRDADVERAAGILLDAGLTFVGISEDNQRVDFLFPRSASVPPGVSVGIFLSSEMRDDEPHAHVYYEKPNGMRLLAPFSHDAAKWIGNSRLAWAGEWNRDLEIAEPVTAPGFGMREIIVINPIEDWRFDIEERNFDAV